MRSIASKLGTALALVLLAGAAGAATDTSQSITVNASVKQSCIAATGATINFSAYDPVGTNASTGTDLSGTGTFTVQCSKGSPTVTIGLGPGNNAVATQRFMKDTTANDTLAYNLLKPTGASLDCTTPGSAWDNTSTLAVPTAFWSTGTAAKTISVCGVVPKGQNSSVGTAYTDSVLITVNF